MKIQMINDSKVRVILDYKELESINISVHSFLAGSLESREIINSIITILNKELHFSKTFEEISYDILSLQNKTFIIVFTKGYTKPIVIYEFETLEDLQNFINSIRKYIYLETISYSIYSSDSKFFIRFDISKKDTIWKNSFLSVLSEFK